MLKVRQVACPVSPGWKVGGRAAQSVTVKGNAGIFIRVCSVVRNGCAHRAPRILYIPWRNRCRPKGKTIMKMTMDNKVAIVTGGSKGIGFAVAKAFAACGARVAMVARGGEALKAA